MTDALRVAVTGATGDFGRSVLAWALDADEVAEVTALGRRPVGVHHPKLREAHLDLAGELNLDAVAGYDALIHLAYQVEEPRDKTLALQVNVVATRELLRRSVAAGIGHLVLTSSANALGVARCGTGRRYDENEYPLGDTDDGHYYFRHKALVEHLANWYWAQAHDESMTLTVLRPCYVVGGHYDNTGLRTLSARVVPFPRPRRSAYQFLADRDLVAAYAAVLARRLGGLYNVAPGDALTVRQICAITGGRVVPAPLSVLAVGAELLYRSRMSAFSAHWVTLGDPLLDAGLLTARTGWAPSGGSADALRDYLAVRAA